MTLTFVQERFTLLVGQLIVYADSQGWGFTFGDAWATTGHEPNSLHYERLAVDLNLFIGGVWVIDDSPEYQTLGAWWKSQDPLARWGGDIVGKRDLNHYSMVPDASDPRI